MEFGFGSGLLTGIRTDVVSSTPRRFGVLQDVNIEFTGETKELFGQYQFPVDTARGKTKITGKAKLAEINTRAYNDLFFGQTAATGQLKYAFNETTTLGTGAASYTVANSGSTPLTDEGVFYVTPLGAQLEGVGTAAPNSGQYGWNASTGVYNFAAADAGAVISVNYLYHVTTGMNLAIGGTQFMGNTPRFKATFFQQFENNQVVLVLNACVSSRLTFPTRIDDYVIEEFDFSAFADSNGIVGSWNAAT